MKGTYAYKKYVYRKKKYQKDEIDYPSRKLFLDILNPIVNDEEKKVYDFRFLIHNEHEQARRSELQKLLPTKMVKRNENECFWFEVGEVLSFENEDSVIAYLASNKNWILKRFSR